MVGLLNKFKNWGSSDTNQQQDLMLSSHETNKTVDRKELPLRNYKLVTRDFAPPLAELKLVRDPGKALAQMVRFKLRFHRKVKRFRERKETTVDHTTGQTD